MILDKLDWEQIVWINGVRKALQKMLKTKGICKLITQAIKREYGYKIVIGRYGGKEHWWNVLPDGSILDASADQFGMDGIVVVSLTDQNNTNWDITRS